eukprot:SAG11_NODE_4297_length_1965_cov_2.383173_2_plen_85_part_00
MDLSEDEELAESSEDEKLAPSEAAAPAPMTAAGGISIQKFIEDFKADPELLKLLDELPIYPITQEPIEEPTQDSVLAANGDIYD